MTTSCDCAISSVSVNVLCIYTEDKECTLRYLALVHVYIQGIKSVPTLFLPCIYSGDKRVCRTLFDPCSIQGKIQKSVVLYHPQ